MLHPPPRSVRSGQLPYAPDCALTAEVRPHAEALVTDIPGRPTIGRLNRTVSIWTEHDVNANPNRRRKLRDRHVGTGLAIPHLKPLLEFRLPAPAHSDRSLLIREPHPAEAAVVQRVAP